MVERSTTVNLRSYDLGMYNATITNHWYDAGAQSIPVL